MAAIAVLIGGAWHTPAYADGGASARNQTATSVYDQTPATPQAYAQRILRTLADDDANKWVRYWRARADCDAARAAYGRGNGDGAAMERVLLGLTGMACAGLDARLGVNPRDYLPQGGEERTVGLVASEAGAAVGYTLFKSYLDHDVFLLDPLGRVAHAWYPDINFKQAKLLDNGNLLGIKTSDRIVELDPRGNIVWSYQAGDDFHHDLLKMPNGNVLLLAAGSKTRDEVIAAGANPEFVNDRPTAYDYLLEVRPTGASGGDVVWEWSSWDHLTQDFDPSKPNYGAIAEHPERIDINFLLEKMSESRPTLRLRRDWTHINTIDYNPALDQIMLSPRHFSELWIIDRSATTEEAGGIAAGMAAWAAICCTDGATPAHTATATTPISASSGSIKPTGYRPDYQVPATSYYSTTAWKFSGDEQFYSFIDELAPTEDGYRYRRASKLPLSPDALTWTYAAETPTDFYAPILSGTQLIPNGNTLIADGTAGTIFQATPDGRNHVEVYRPAAGSLTYGRASCRQKPCEHSKPHTAIPFPCSKTGYIAHTGILPTIRDYGRLT